jgi:hypothetical protein
MLSEIKQRAKVRILSLPLLRKPKLPRISQRKGFSSFDPKTEMETCQSDNENDNRGNNEGSVTGRRRPKHKLALLMGFCGTGYHGMQM